MPMNKRVYFLGSLGFAIAALIVHCIARHFLHEAMHEQVASIREAVKQHGSSSPDMLAVQAREMWKILTGAGVVLTILGILCMCIAGIRHEKGAYLILLVVFIFDIGIPMLL
jgi:hypothetical protein